MTGSHSNILESHSRTEDRPRAVPPTPIREITSPPSARRSPAPGRPVPEPAASAASSSSSSDSNDLAKLVEQLSKRLDQEINSRVALENSVKKMEKLLDEETRKRKEIEIKLEQIVKSINTNPKPLSNSTTNNATNSNNFVDKKVKATYDYDVRCEKKNSRNFLRIF